MGVAINTYAYVWGLPHRFWNKLMHILHGNTSFPGIAAFSDEARLGLALLGGGSAERQSDEVRIQQSEWEDVWVTPSSSPARAASPVRDAQELDIMQQFGDPRLQPRVVISLAEALAASVESRLAAACSARPVVNATLPEHPRAAPALPTLPEQVCCPRCWQALTPCASTGVTCFSCSGSPKPGGQAFNCEQCGVQICCTCMPSTSLVAEVVPSVDVQAEAEVAVASSGDGAGFAAACALVPALPAYGSAEVGLGPVVIGAQRRRRRKRQCPMCHGTRMTKLVPAPVVTPI